jgi:S1-C subfamily serine protease
MAREKKPRGVTFGGLRRRKSDSNSVWGHLANEDAILMNTNSAWRLPTWVLPTVAVAALATLVGLCFLVYGLYTDKPNVAQVVSKAREATFEVSCGNSAGSGVGIIAPLPDGYKTAVLSVAHIFDDCDEGDKVLVTAAGKDYEGVLYRKDPTGSFEDNETDSVNDIALIYLKYKLPALEAAPAANAGDWAIVIGNPWDEINYATFGIVTSVKHDEYATDAAVNKGNSGGPMLDSQGRVLGLVSYKSMHSESDLDSRNKSDVLDADHGMSYVKRLRLACEHLYSGAPTCPFKY